MNRREAWNFLQKVSGSLDSTLALLPQDLEGTENPLIKQRKKVSRLQEGVALISKEVLRTSPFAEELDKQYIDGCKGFQNMAGKEHLETTKAVEQNLDGLMNSISGLGDLLKKEGKFSNMASMMENAGEFLGAFKQASEADASEIDEDESQQRLKKLESAKKVLTETLEQLRR